jgi:hypothetical protein
MLSEVGNSVFVDSLAYNQFKSYAKPAHQICKYSLPRKLQFKNFREMIKFQHYLEIVAAGDFVDLPKALHSAEEIMDSYPQLVYKEFEIEVASVTKEEAAAEVGLKETWKWEGENFADLKKEFPVLASCKSEKVEDRMDALDQLDEATRFKVDQFARMAIIEADPSRVQAALGAAQSEKQLVKVALGKNSSSFSGEHFLALLEIEDPSLAYYTVDGDSFYSIKVLNKGKGWNLFSFEEADMDQVLDRFLQTAYSSMKIKEPFEEAKDQVAAKAYADLLKSIAVHTKIGGLDDYAVHRFDNHLRMMRELAIKNVEAFEQTQQGMWALDKREETAADASIAIGDFSPVQNGSFYQLLDIVEASATDSELASVKEHLKRDAEAELMRKLLKRI